MKILTRLFCSISLCFFSSQQLYSQLIVGTVGTPEELAESLVGSGVVISNVTLNCPNGAWGSFDATDASLGMDSGIILACGNITNAVGPNLSSGITTDFFANGDPDLEALAGQTTHDACVLEFDVKATGDTLKFKYVFASDEYTEYVGSINDIFAFFISGPGIAVPQNIALLPGTSDPVSISTVNCLNGSPYYICNDPSNSPYQCDDSYNCPTDPGETSIEYDGLTVVLTAIAVVQPCETYHLKLAIADASDGILDSGVFIEAGSLVAAGISIDPVSAYIDPVSNLPAVVEGCLDGSFAFVLSNPLTDTTFIHYTITGSAIEGTDYSPIPDSIMVLPGATNVSLGVHPIADAIAEGAESIKLSLFLSCSPIAYDSATIYIVDNINAVANDDTTICAGQSVTLSVNDADSYNWGPTIGLSCTTCQNPVATPIGTTSYIVFITIGTCIASDTVTITVDNPTPVQAGGDMELCFGQSVQLNATNATFYTWTPATGLSSTTVPNPTATPSVTTTYYVTGVNGCFSTTDTITVIVHPLPDVTVSPGFTVCPGDMVNLFASGGISYSWFPVNGVSNPDSASTTATVDFTTEYIVLVTDNFGCVDTGKVLYTTYDIPDITISDDTLIYLGNSYPIIVTGGTNYQWSPSTGLSSTNTADPIATPTETTTYTVTITTADGCILIDSVTVAVKYDALVEVASGFSPNNDGTNDVLHVLARGVFNLKHFYIFNRWGELVFETTDLAKGWDGKLKNEPQEVGVYVYSVDGTDIKGLTIQKHGSVTLLR
ncbi:MAG: choice-of-anchor L domain-containing protein [Chitinophagaceae bacterium]|nr:choice-of-anchor L domain-containing protein [Chitinophagaceae bacterium]